MGKFHKRWLTVILAAPLVLPAVALAHDNSITATSSCTPNLAGRWSAQFSIVNDYRLGEAIALSGAVKGTINDGPNGTVTVAKGEPRTILTATEVDHGTWSDGYFDVDGESATANRPPNCRTTPPPPPPPAPPAPKVAHPSARVNGPCGDPYYQAVFNNSRSTKAVTFEFNYTAFSGRNVSIFRTVGARAVRTTTWHHVLGNTRLRVVAFAGGSPRTLVLQRSAAPGNYGWGGACR